MLTAYNDQANKAGIYFIKNIINNRLYVGSCKIFKDRFRDHVYSLNKGVHRNKFLQNDFNKCGTDSFVFEVIEVIDGDTEYRRKIEEKYIELYFDDRVQCYNIRKKTVITDQSCFYKTPEETREKQSKAMKGRKKTLLNTLRKLEKQMLAELSQKRQEEKLVKLV